MIKESDIERAVCEHANTRGIWPLKLSIINHAGFPDRLMVGRGEIWFIEFKAPGKKPSPLQLHVHTQLKNRGFEVYVIDDTATGKAIIERLAARLPG